MGYIFQVFFLFLSNSIKFIIPILFLPLSSRLMGSHDFESLSIAISFSTWCAVIIEYGFNYSVAKGIKFDNSEKRLLAVISSTLSAKMMLSLVAFALGIYTASYIGKFSVLFVVLFWLYSFFVGGGVSFIYTCLNNNKLLLKIEFVGGCVFLFIIFIIWQLKVGDFYLLFGSMVIYRGVVFLLGVFFLKSVIDPRRIKMKVRSGLRLIKKTFSYALFQVSSSMYLSGLGFVASFAIGKNFVIYHLLAERIAKLIMFSFNPVSRVAYSYLNNIDDNKRLKPIFLLCGIAIFFGVGAIGIIIASSRQIVTLFFGDDFLAAYVNLNILSIALPFAFLNGVMCISVFLPKGNMKYLNVIIASAGFLIIPTCFFLARYIPLLSASVSYVIIEVYIFVMLMIKFAPRVLSMRRL